MKKGNEWLKNVLYAGIIVVVGFMLFNAAFLFAWMVNTAYRTVVLILFRSEEGIMNLLLPQWHMVYLVIILLVSWLMFRIRAGDLFKATYSTMPLAVVLVVIGLKFYEYPLYVYLFSAVFLAAVFLYLYRKKCSWLYYFATIYVSVILLIVQLMGVDI